MKITMGNAKLGKFIPNLNQPAGITCRADAPCKKGCYACKGAFNYENVKESHRVNLNAFLSDSNKFFNDIIDYLNNGLVIYKFFRWHSSGDIVNMKYLIGMIKVAKACPMTNFLAFTKKFELVNLYLSVHQELPSNLTILFSAWDRDFKVENPFNLPIAYVDFKKKEKNPKMPKIALKCDGHCSKCQGCWNLKKGESVILEQH